MALRGAEGGFNLVLIPKMMIPNLESGIRVLLMEHDDTFLH